MQSGHPCSLLILEEAHFLVGILLAIHLLYINNYVKVWSFLFFFSLGCIHKCIHTCSYMYRCMCMDVHAHVCRGLKLISSVFSIALHFIYFGREHH